MLTYFSSAKLFLFLDELIPPPPGLSRTPRREPLPRVPQEGEAAGNAPALPHVTAPGDASASLYTDQRRDHGDYGDYRYRCSGEDGDIVPGRPGP